MLSVNLDLITKPIYHLNPNANPYAHQNQKLERCFYVASQGSHDIYIDLLDSFIVHDNETDTIHSPTTTIFEAFALAQRLEANRA